MSAPAELAYSRTFPLSTDEAYSRVLTLPLPGLFGQRQLAIAPIQEVRGQQGEWGTVGQTRTIVLSDGASMLETLTRAEPGQAFGYSMTELKGPLKLLVAGADGLWSFAPDGAGTKVTWAWRVHPKGLLGRLGMPLFASMWKGYAAKGFDKLAAVLR